MRNVLEKLTSWVRDRVSGKTQLQRNAEKALHMKREAENRTRIPEERKDDAKTKGPRKGQ